MTRPNVAVTQFPALAAPLLLLVRTLPAVAAETCFALKGGTAINLFIRDMPRLSVDIDLTFLPVAPREESLAAIEAALLRITDRLKTAIRGVQITESRPGAARQSR